MADERGTVAVESLSHRYDGRDALCDVSFQVEHGTIFALLGPNGGGKSTLFKILTTLIRPTAGTARVAGADVRTEPNRVRQRIGIVFQKSSVDAKLTVLENLKHQGHLYGLSGRPLAERCDEVLGRFDLDERRDDRTETLSGGLQRRVELAKGLLHRPRVLILDEPGTGLDPAARAGFMAHLSELRDREGLTCMLTTHLMDEADRCDRIGFLDRGRLLALDSPAALKRTIGGDVLTIAGQRPLELAGKITARFGIQADVVHGAVRLERDRGHEFITALVEAFPGEIDSVAAGKPTLEDVFVRLSGHKLSDDERSHDHP
jgi:ABC-2 type transport system ATP-binding protein